MSSEKIMVSVILITYQRPLRLLRALLSIDDQFYSAVEIIVVNDGGEPVDDVIGRFHSISGLPIQYVAFASNQGIARARSAAIKIAKGQILAILDDDDRFLPEHLSCLVPMLLDGHGAVLAYDDVVIQVEAGPTEAEQEIIATCRFGRPYDKSIFDQDDFIVPSSMVILREAAETIGGFDVTIPACEDWDFLLRLRDLGSFIYAAGVPGVEYSLRLHGSDNVGSIFDERRLHALELLSQRYHLPHLVPKTFLGVARDLGFPLVPVNDSVVPFPL